MKRVHVLERPTPVNEIANLEIDTYDNEHWQARAERMRLRRWRRIKQQLA